MAGGKNQACTAHVNQGGAFWQTCNKCGYQACNRCNGKGTRCPSCRQGFMG